MSDSGSSSSSEYQSDVEKGVELAASTSRVARFTRFITTNKVVKHDGITYLIFKKDEALCFAGLAEICVIAGTFNVYGFAMTPSHRWHSITSPVGGPCIVLHVEKVADNIPSVSGLDSTVLRGADAILALRPHRQQIHYRGNTRRVLQNIPREDIQQFDVPGFYPILAPIAGVQPLATPEAWDQLWNDCFDIPMETGRKWRATLLCGAKGAGKSTLARYLINRTLAKCGRVAYLETDVGQAGYTPPGLVSLHVFTAPMFGPSEEHMDTPMLSFFIGDVSPASDPNYFIACIARLMTRFGELAGVSTNELPLIVNTHGWVRGLGYNLLLEIVRLARPTNIVQISSRNEAKDLPVLDAGVVLTAPSMSRAQRSEPMAWRCHVLETALPHNRGPVHHASSRRNKMLMRYLCGSDNATLVDAVPYCVPWGVVRLRVMEAQIPNTEILYVFNASVVGLCCDAREFPESQTQSATQLSILDHTPVCECVGLGVIRSIDTTERVFHIITQVSAAVLRRVNVLMRGKLEVPVSVLLEGPKEVTPYAVADSVVGESSGASPLKPKGHLKRQRVDT